MGRTTTIAAVAASAAALAPSAFATPLPPIDAGSNQPNPLYTHKIPPIDAGSDEINPAYYFDPVTQSVRRVHPTPVRAPRGEVGGSGFAWAWAAAGSGVAGLFTAAGAALLLRRRRAVASVAR